MALVVKKLPANAGDVRDVGLIPGSEDPLEKEMAPYFSILAERIPRTEEPAGLYSWGRKEPNMTEHLSMCMRASLDTLD